MGRQPVKTQDPEAPAAVSPSAGGLTQFDLGQLTVPTISASVQPGPVGILPAARDITEITEDVTETFTGTVTTTLLFNNALDHFTIADATGKVVWNQSGGLMQELTNIAFLNPGAGGAFGGTNTTVANQTTAQENVAQLAGFRLPAAYGPWKLTPFYNTIQGSGGTQATADTTALRVGGHYGPTGGLTSYYLEQVFTFNVGYSYWSQFCAAKNIVMQGMFWNPVTLSQLDEFYLEWNGAVIEPLTYGLALTARQNSAYSAVSIPSSSLIYAPPVARRAWAFNDSSQSRVHFTTQNASVKIGYYYLA